MPHYLTVGHPDQTGDAIYVDDIRQLRHLKSPDTVYATNGVYTLDVPVVITVPSTIFAPFDFGGCRIVMGVTGMLQGYNPNSQAITSVGLNPVAPFITARNSTALRDMTIVGVGIALDLDGTAGGPLAALGIFRVFVVGCGLTGTIKDYSAGVVAELFFAIQCGTLTILGAFDVITFRDSKFQPPDGVLALDFPSGEIRRSFDVIFSAVILDFAGSSGAAVDPAVVLRPEGLHFMRFNFSDSAGGVPVGVPIPPGMLDADSNKALIVDCDNILNSATASYVSMVPGNVTPTVMPGAATPAKVVGVTATEKARKFEHPIDNRHRFVGSRAELVTIVFRGSFIGLANRAVTAFIAVGDDDTIAAMTDPVIATESAGSAPIPVGGDPVEVLASHMVDVDPDKHTFAEMWAQTDDGSSVTFKTMNAQIYKVPP